MPVSSLRNVSSELVDVTVSPGLTDVVYQDGNGSNRWLNIIAYGADPTGNEESTNAVAAALAAAAALGGAVVYFPRGIYLLRGGVLTATAGTYILGDGPIVVEIVAVAGVAGPIFTLGGQASEQFDLGISGMYFRSSDTTTQKTMVRVSDCANVVISKIMSQDNTWIGATSIGIQLRGRQSIHVVDCEIYTDQPISIEVNPNLASNSLDHSCIENSSLVVTGALTNPSIKIADGCTLTQVDFRNLGWTRGAGGIFFSNTTAATASIGINITNCRSEQTAGAAQYTIDLESTNGQIQNVTINNITFDAGLRGMKFRKMRASRVSAISFGGTGVWLDIDSTSDPLYVTDSVVNVSATKTLGANTKYFWDDPDGRKVFQSALPGISAISGLGTGTATVVANSNDYAGSVLLSPTGAPGSGGGFTLTFNTALNSQCTVILTLHDGTGTWATSATTYTTTTTNGNFTAAWQNVAGGAASNLTAGSTYFVDYMMLPKNG